MKEVEYNRTFERAVLRSETLEKAILANPARYRVLTGDRPTGRLHVGHYFGSLRNRVRLSRLGIPTMILIADYQVLTDHDAFDKISENTKELVLDYLASGIEPSDKVFIFPHSYVPAANQLLLPFLSLVGMGELERNPTTKDEIKKSSANSLSAGLLTYPVHQAVDILFCHANVVPVGKDQLPHLELAREIARRFNEKFAKGLPTPYFQPPEALLSKTPAILGLDGKNKMSKSLNNAIYLSSTEDETAKLIKKAVTDSERTITFEPERRPEVSNLLTLISLSTGEEPAEIAKRIGPGGAGKLKEELTATLNETLRPLREKRHALEKETAYIREVLLSGAKKANEIAEKTLSEVRKLMNMEI